MLIVLAMPWTQDLSGSIRESDDKNLWITHRQAIYSFRFNLTPSEVPFGGFKMSGIGRENGLAAIEHFTQTKTM